jgi:simple sugar transport system substrate-binding protein
MMRKLKVGLILGLAAVFAFAMIVVPGCKAAAPEVVEKIVTETVVETEIVEKEVEGEKHFSGISIYFFPGGPEGCPFASVVYKGALAAQNDLGPDVTYLWSDWNPEKMISQFKEAIAAAPDGICIMGHPGEAAFFPLVDEAESKGIIVTSQNTDLPNIETKYVASGFGYAGQGLYTSGLALAKQSIVKWGLEAGDRAMVWGLLSQETRGLRSKGCIDGLEAAGLTVDYLEISDEINADASLGTPVLTGYIASKPDVKLIITDHGGLTATVATYAKASNLNPGDVKFAGFDLSAASVDAIKSGYLGLILDQQPWLQGYLPILQVCLTKRYLFSGLHIDTGSGFVDENNVEALEGLAAEGIR